MNNPEILVVGAGLSGATIAREYAEQGIRVLVIDKRDHIGGNVYDYIDMETGIRMSKYGAHLFHTNDAEVWAYVQRFGSWARWDHRVVADVSGKYLPIPVNINTVNGLFNENIQTSAEMNRWLEEERAGFNIGDWAPKHSEDVALKRVGWRLYKTLFKPYTIKQWAKQPVELEPSVLERIPVRNDFDDRYFSDRFQGLPVDGYTNIVHNMLDHPNITVKLHTDWLSITDKTWKELVFTGPIDVYFKDKGLPALEYRSIQFEIQRHKCDGYLQPNSVVNYPSPENIYTRCVEYKHFLHQKSAWTVMVREKTCAEGEPYYPVPTQNNRDIYNMYANLAEKETGVHFVGRLASYKYFNMDQAIRNSLDYFKKVLLPRVALLKMADVKMVVTEIEEEPWDKMD